MHFAETLQQLVDRRDLATPQAEGLMDWLMEGQATDAQIGGVLTALRMKGVVPDELVGFARAMRAKATMLDHRFDRLVDTCGTGGGKPSFNMSTAAAIVAASAGAKVAKHGNRGVTSSCGSADVLEQLGVRFSDDPEVLSKVL
ncbi:MAG: anthranilate phosphoribosyltransferase, partial [Fimbriimonadaceae bacterium]|nr:anthranilate phosphoribosyltransferase [Fimbriimonadaceae bacterium]